MSTTKLLTGMGREAILVGLKSVADGVLTIQYTESGQSWCSFTHKGMHTASSDVIASLHVADL